MNNTKLDPVYCACGRLMMAEDSGKYIVKGRVVEVGKNGARAKCRCKLWVDVPIVVGR